MKIAQISPLMEAVPPKLYGGTERIVAYLCEELVALGHEVTLFASGDCTTKRGSMPPGPRRFGWTSACGTTWPRISSCWSSWPAAADDFDVVHFHVDYMGFPLLRRPTCPM